MGRRMLRCFSQLAVSLGARRRQRRCQPPRVPFVLECAPAPSAIGLAQSAVASVHPRLASGAIISALGAASPVIAGGVPNVFELEQLVGVGE